MASSLLAMRGASSFFTGGVVAYSKHAKQTMLGLDQSSSKPTATEAHALEMAMAVRERLATDWAVGESGVAGPTPNSRGISPGVCALAVVGPRGVRHTRMLWPEDELGAADAYGQPRKFERHEAMQQFAAAGLQMLDEVVAAEEVKGGS